MTPPPVLKLIEQSFDKLFRKKKSTLEKKITKLISPKGRSKVQRISLNYTCMFTLLAKLICKQKKNTKTKYPLYECFFLTFSDSALNIKWKFKLKIW